MLADIVATPAQTIDDVIAKMTAIDASLADADGLKWFNRLYLQVSVGVRAEVAGAAFEDKPFLTALDVVFANLYFAAVSGAEARPATPPRAWRPLFDSRRSPGIARLQFALAGMNAHINRDLPEALVRAFRQLGGTPLAITPRRRDFDRVNDLLERVEEQAKRDFTLGVVGDIDRLAGRLDDIKAMWSVREARATAWTNAEVLWTLQQTPPLNERYFDRLDRLTGFAGRGLLVPVTGGLSS
jgi:Family of unknown function (DUF5995)